MLERKVRAEIIGGLLVCKHLSSTTYYLADYQKIQAQTGVGPALLEFTFGSGGAPAHLSSPHLKNCRAGVPQRPVHPEIVQRSRAAQGFTVLPKRWIVERTLGWCNRSRRLSKDDEFLPETRGTMIRAAMVHIMVRRLARIAL
jgi:hypothetical protein